MSRKPAHVALDSQQIQLLAEMGCTIEEIAKLARVSESTLQKRFRAELEIGKALLCKNIRAAQITLAIEKLNPTMLIWLGKQYLKQRNVVQEKSEDEEQHSQTIVVELTDANKTE